MYDTNFGSRRRRLAANLTLLLGSTLVAIALCEAGARLLLPAPQTVKVHGKEDTFEAPGGFDRLDTKAEKSIDSVVLFGGPHGVRLRPNTRGEIHNHVLSGRDVVIEVNSLGLRYAELGPKAPDEFRVLVLGDSITFGDFVLENETWTRQMESLTVGRKKTVRFVNAGLPGAGTAEELALFREIGERVKPDLVLLGMYLNDAQSGSLFFTKKLPDPWAKSRFLTWFADRFQLLDSRFFRNAFPGEIDPRWRETFRAGRALKTGDMFGTRDGFDFEIYNAYMDFGLGWNPTATGFDKGKQCTLAGGYVPFAKTKAERTAKGDPRLSLEERYKDHAGYVAVVKAAAAKAVTERFLLKEDADKLIAQAEASDVLRN